MLIQSFIGIHVQHGRGNGRSAGLADYTTGRCTARASPSKCSGGGNRGGNGRVACGLAADISESRDAQSRTCMHAQATRDTEASGTHGWRQCGVA